MGPTFRCWVVVWLLGAGSADVSVTQHPRHLVLGRGQEATLRCSPVKGLDYIYWYRQLPGDEVLKFLICLGREQIIDKSGMPEKRFSAEFPKKGPSVFKVQMAEPGDSAVYFCANPWSTPIESDIHLEHKRPPGPAPKQAQLREMIGPQWAGMWRLLSYKPAGRHFARGRREQDRAAEIAQNLSWY